MDRRFALCIFFISPFLQKCPEEASIYYRLHTVFNHHCLSITSHHLTNATLDAAKRHDCFAILHPIREFTPVKTVLRRNCSVAVNRRPLPQEPRKQKVLPVRAGHILVGLNDWEAVYARSEVRMGRNPKLLVIPVESQPGRSLRRQDEGHVRRRRFRCDVRLSKEGLNLAHAPQFPYVGTARPPKVSAKVRGVHPKPVAASVALALADGFGALLARRSRRALLPLQILALPRMEGAFGVDVDDVIRGLFLAVFVEGVQCNVFVACRIVVHVHGLEIVEGSTIFFHETVI
mmetsp:Transcript_3142/g.8018  ORF Transcript_3142/g.8018 Transcript_3142/m.8018 type:complete len:289 (-) Transcript_3142:751-1617(-)